MIFFLSKELEWRVWLHMAEGRDKAQVCDFMWSCTTR